MENNSNRVLGWKDGGVIALAIGACMSIQGGIRWFLQPPEVKKEG